MTVHAFGIASGAALVIGYAVAQRRARLCGLDARRIGWMYLSLVAIGLVAGHLAVERGGRLDMAIWRGQSAWGAAIGCLIGMIFFAIRLGGQVYEYLDALVFASPWMWAVARCGCFLAHDHPGARSASWLAVAFPGGGRYDLGLLECLAAVAVGSLLLLWKTRWKPPGVLAAVVTVCAIAIKLAVTAMAG